ncbi:ribosomal protein L11 [Strigomonas culicis]|nr:ribosomal protein L11 [Strigomonas culicis]|eukprot:EPY30702.1 ribosomal protein L11 [Strigomonas culicis]
MKGHYCALITLEMCYEIAKMKQISWGKVEYPPIETRVRRVVGQARRMGVCVIGVDTHSSPVKDQTPREYEKACAAYRAVHMEQYAAFKQQELEAAPLYERLHRVNFAPLSTAQLEEGLADARLFNALWRASHPKSPYARSLRDREMARRYLNTRGWLADMSPDEMRTVFHNYRLPEGERRRQEALSEDADGGDLYWLSREQERAAAPPPHSP